MFTKTGRLLAIFISIVSEVTAGKNPKQTPPHAEKVTV